MTILIVNICKEKLHYLEFVKPIEDILEEEEIEFKSVHYKKITDKDLFSKKIKKIIICGTSLKDNDFLENIEKFKWIKIVSEDFKKPILGICGGMQVISLIYYSYLTKNTQIGMNKIEFKKDFLNIKSKEKIEVYELHNNTIEINKDNFNICASSKNSVQAIKHKEFEIYGTLFHPEVRNKNMIKNFCKL